MKVIRNKDKTTISMTKKEWLKIGESFKKTAGATGPSAGGSGPTMGVTPAMAATPTPTDSTSSDTETTTTTEQTTNDPSSKIEQANNILTYEAKKKELTERIRSMRQQLVSLPKQISALDQELTSINRSISFERNKQISTSKA